MHGCAGRPLSLAATTSNAWGLTWVYDGFGNRLQQNVTKGTGPSSVIAVDPYTNRMTGSGFLYDSNGNMTQWTTLDGTNTVGYDVENRAASVSFAGTATTYTYGQGNVRLAARTSSSTTVYVYGLGGELLGKYTACGNARDTLCAGQPRIYFAGRLVLRWADSTYWESVRTDQVGSVGTQYPYGDLVNPAGSDSESFGTYYQDGSGLD